MTPTIDRQELDDLKSRVDLTELFRQYGLEPKRRGKNWFCHCPFHDGDAEASLSINNERRLWQCFSCKAAGDAFDFLRLKEKLDFPAALAVLLLVALGIESVDLERITNPSLPVSRLSAVAAVVYFMSGFLLYSHARLALLRARWQLDGANVAEGVPERWLRVSWITVAGVVSLAAILPRTEPQPRRPCPHSPGLLRLADAWRLAPKSPIWRISAVTAPVIPARLSAVMLAAA